MPSKLIYYAVGIAGTKRMWHPLHSDFGPLYLAAVHFEVYAVTLLAA